MGRVTGVAAVALLALTLVLGGRAPAQTREFVILFGTDQSRLTREAQAIVDLIVARARQQHPATIAVAGYGDGDTAHDAVLADQRAKAVIAALAAAGIGRETLKETAPQPADKAPGIPVHKVTVTLEP
jgi:outer membrane protein OmpA-like peptidoglycan-associated protein